MLAAPKPAKVGARAVGHRAKRERSEGGELGELAAGDQVHEGQWLKGSASNITRPKAGPSVAGDA